MLLLDEKVGVPMTLAMGDDERAGHYTVEMHDRERGGEREASWSDLHEGQNKRPTWEAVDAPKAFAFLSAASFVHVRYQPTFNGYINVPFPCFNALPPIYTIQYI